MNIAQICLLLGGIALFLFGMTLMGDGLKTASGSSLEPILFRLTGTPLKGILLGVGVTAVIQSSCATSVMAVGFVNAGMMKVRQAMGIILGSLLGTSVTGWVICLGYIDGGAGIGALLSSGNITAMAAVAGIALRIFGKREASRHIGDILLGFAILMLGMSTMSGAVGGLGEQPWFTHALTSMTHPILGFLVGAAFTALLQSASAAVGIIQALSVTGAMTFSSVLPLLMGVTVGASVPVLLSALGANTEGKRAAMVYLIASVLGAAVCGGLFYGADAILHLAFVQQAQDPFTIAAANTIFRLAMLVVLIPLMGVMEAAVNAIFPQKREGEERPPRLEERFLDYPALAIEQCRGAVSDMAGKARDALFKAAALIERYDPSGFSAVSALEEEADHYEDALGSYLVKFSGRALTRRQNREVSKFLHVLTDLERITDHALNIAQSARELHDKHIAFSPEASRELSVTADAVREATGLATDALTADDMVQAERIEPLVKVISRLCDKVEHNHVMRLQQGKCTIENGFILNDIVANYERVAAHCSNIAVAMIELEHDSFDPHNYVESLVRRKNEEFDRYYAQYKGKYVF